MMIMISLMIAISIVLAKIISVLSLPSPHPQCMPRPPQGHPYLFPRQSFLRQKVHGLLSGAGGFLQHRHRQVHLDHQICKLIIHLFIKIFKLYSNWKYGYNTRLETVLEVIYFYLIGQTLLERVWCCPQTTPVVGDAGLSKDNILGTQDTPALTYSLPT